MGLNMPAKTVVFTAVKKWDGDSHRYIGSGEYIQVSEDSVVFLRAFEEKKIDAATCVQKSIYICIFTLMYLIFL